MGLTKTKRLREKLRRKLEKKMMTQNNDITQDMIREWVGSDNLSVPHLISILAEIANGFYRPHELASDVIGYAYIMKEENKV